jgi:hypothetical protein
MLASADSESRSHDALPVCRWKANSNRLVSLWDIVNVFDCVGLQIVLKRMQLARGLLDPDDKKSAAALEEWVRENSRQRGEAVPGELIENLAEMREIEGDLRKPAEESIEKLREFCEAVGFANALPVIRFAGYHLREDPTAGELRSELRHLEETVFLELAKRKFLHIEADRAWLLEQDDLFGPAVTASFPSASRDIREAGNCLAAECTTAAVFHLMRAAEFALRSLAKDRDVSFKDRPLDEKEWGQILMALEKRLSDLRSSDRKCWPVAEARDAQIRFYNEVVQELRGFNDAWRRHISHADTLAFYARDEALGVLKHVRAFLQKISERISETSVTEQYWTSLL